MAERKFGPTAVVDENPGDYKIASAGYSVHRAKRFQPYK
jgi:hypothetical protein